MDETVTPIEAVYAFCGWMTCRKEAVIFGANYDCARIAELIEEFRKSQNWEVCKEDWTKNIKRYPVE